jgi:hypothetical protein
MKNFTFYNLKIIMGDYNYYDDFENVDDFEKT